MCTGPLKRCIKCGACWNTLSDLVLDHDLVVDGYWPSFGSAEDGLVLFTHIREYCRSTITIRAEARCSTSELREP